MPVKESDMENPLVSRKWVEWQDAVDLVDELFRNVDVTQENIDSLESLLAAWKKDRELRKVS